MSTSALSEQQSEALGRILNEFLEECEVDAIAVCDIGGNVLAEKIGVEGMSIETPAVLAAGSFAATRELASVIGETRFKSIVHRGQKSGVFIQALTADFLVMVILSEKSIEGLVRLYIRKVGKQIESILAEAEGQSVESAGATGRFEIEESSEFSS